MRFLGFGQNNGNSGKPLPEIEKKHPIPWEDSFYNEHLSPLIPTSLALNHRVASAEYHPGLPRAHSGPVQTVFDLARPALPRTFEVS